MTKKVCDVYSLMDNKHFQNPEIARCSQEVRMIRFCPGDLPSAEDLGRLVNLDAVKNSIGQPVTDSQRETIRRDLDVAIDEFIKREQSAQDASFTIPFVTVNNRTNIVAIHSRLLLALQHSVLKSIEKLRIPPNSGAFDEVSQRIRKCSKKYWVFFLLGLPLKS